ncbi:ComEC family competence protein [compost metagenome]
MKRSLFIFCLITFSCSLVAEEFVRKYFIVWNVGQGQWATRVDARECWHFDRGGEFFPGKFRKLCARKTQKLFISHWDWDHVGGIGALDSGTCLAKGPIGKSNRRKMSLVAKFKPCPSFPQNIFSWTPEIGAAPVISENPKRRQTKSLWRRAKPNSNDSSHIFLTDSVLIPGDAPVSSEKQWLHSLPLSSVKILLLGHHGSKTSTSQELLDELPRLKQAVSSARWRRYHHPHPEVAARLAKARVALLRTEDWGNIWFEL